MKPKIVFMDIETAPNVLTAFGLHSEQYLPYQGILQERFVICVSWKFNDEKVVHTSMIKKAPNDKQVIKDFYNAILKADAVCAHHGDGYDLKYLNGRLAYHGMDPLPKVTQLDTYKMSKSKLLLNSYKLDYLGQYFRIGKKKHVDLSVWQGCMNNDPLAKKKMADYNVQDVLLLEKLFYKLEPFAKPKMKLGELDETCNRCNGNVTKQGFHLTLKGKVQRYQCSSCGGWQ